MTEGNPKINYLRVFIERILLWASSPIILKWFSRKLAILIGGFLVVASADLEPALKALIESALSVIGILAFAATDFAERKYNKPPPIDVTPRPDTYEEFLNQPRK